jgi:integrase
MRKGEVLGLKWSDIDFKQGFILIQRTIQRIKTSESSYITLEGSPKSKNSIRVIPILDEQITRLKSHYTRSIFERKKLDVDFDKNGYVFCNRDGSILSPRNFDKQFHVILKDCKIPDINFHALRHTFATVALENGIGLKETSDILGHSSITITADIYSHVTNKRKKEEMEKLKNAF